MEILHTLILLLWKLQMLRFHISSAQFAFQGLYTHLHFQIFGFTQFHLIIIACQNRKQNFTLKLLFAQFSKHYNNS